MIKKKKINENLLEEENKKKKIEEENEEIDVVNIQRIIYNSDSDSNDEEIFFIPVTPDVIQNNNSYSPSHLSTVQMDTNSPNSDYSY